MALFLLTTMAILYATRTRIFIINTQKNGAETAVVEFLSILKKLRYHPLRERKLAIYSQVLKKFLGKFDIIDPSSQRLKEAHQDILNFHLGESIFDNLTPLDLEINAGKLFRFVREIKPPNSWKVGFSASDFEEVFCSVFLPFCERLLNLEADRTELKSLTEIFSELGIPVADVEKGNIASPIYALQASLITCSSVDQMKEKIREFCTPMFADWKEYETSLPVLALRQGTPADAVEYMKSCGL